MKTRIIIDNCIVTKFGVNGICIKPIKLVKNYDITKYQVITVGNRKKDNDILHQLSDGSLTYDNLVNTYLS